MWLEENKGKLNGSHSNGKKTISKVIVTTLNPGSINVGLPLLRIDFINQSFLKVSGKISTHNQERKWVHRISTELYDCYNCRGTSNYLWCEPLSLLRSQKSSDDGLYHSETCHFTQGLQDCSDSFCLVRIGHQTRYTLFTSPETWVSELRW